MSGACGANHQHSGRRLSQWQRLDSKVIWVDLVRMLVSLLPTFLSVVVFGGRLDSSVVWPAVGVTVTGVVASAADLLRWAKTRYRITGEHVECRTGLLVRGYRSIPRDRIRSVDTSAKLRHRLAGLRVVVVRTGERSAKWEWDGEAGGASLKLDAVSRAAAARLQVELPTGRHAAAPAAESTETVLATLRWQWLPYNVFTVWAFVMAAGLLWGTYWLGNSVGLNLAAFVAGLADWRALGTGWTITIAVLATGAVGVVGLAANFVTENWGFRLTRATTAHGTVLRTTKGLFRTREVDRDERRVRGVELSQPLLWRWLGMTDTTVISTGLSMSASLIVPRGPAGDANRIASGVLGDERPLAAPLARHPRTALRRRLGWAVLVAGPLALLPHPLWLIALGALPVLLWCAVLAYRALGHTLTGEYLVTRGGLNRSTVVLRRDAVIGWTFRQSLLQRRLGLMTVTATTAAGRGSYPTRDLSPPDAVTLADRVAPGLVTPYHRR